MTGAGVRRGVRGTDAHPQTALVAPSVDGEVRVSLPQSHDTLSLDARSALPRATRVPAPVPRRPAPSLLLLSGGLGGGFEVWLPRPLTRAKSNDPASRSDAGISAFGFTSVSGTRTGILGGDSSTLIIKHYL